MTKDLNKINPGPFGSIVTNCAVIEKKGESFECAGVRDFMDRESKKVDADTMFGEGSIGKVRFAGLAYMLQQNKIINLQDNAKDFFVSKKFKKFLYKKYPNDAEALQKAIVGFFSGDEADKTSSANATLADLTTHYSGVGDLTRDGGRLVAIKGIEYQCPVLELILPGEHSNPDLRIGDKLRAQGPTSVVDKDLPPGEYNKHQYSNLGYMLLGLAMEAAYDDENRAPSNKIKDYKQLMKDFMLQGFSSTKFPEDIIATDNVVKANWVENTRLVDGNKVSVANAAGGMFASAKESTEFFEKFFAGFPGTKNYGKDSNNKFFKPETIDLMAQEWMKHPPANWQDVDRAKKGGDEVKLPEFLRFQGPGFCVDYLYDESYYSRGPDAFFASHLPNNYIKTGGTFGYNSMMKFNPQTGDAFIGIVAQENLTDSVAKKLDVKTESVKACYSKSGTFDRYMMLERQAPELLEQRTVQQKIGRFFTEKVRDKSSDGHHIV